MKAQARILASILAVAVLATLAPGAAANHDRPVACVGDEGPELPGVCYDPDDYDSCDVYVGLGGGNQVCAVGAQNTCSSQSPEWPGTCWAPREECKLWASSGGGRIHCLYPVGATTSTEGHTDPYSTCVILDAPIGPDGLCYDTSRDTCQFWLHHETGGFHETCLT